MVTLSPPVSPRVVARILMIQNPRVTAGTFVSAALASSFTRILLVDPRRGISRQFDNCGQARIAIVEIELPAVQFGDRADEIQPEAMPRGVAADVQSLETLSDAAAVGFRHAGAVVDDLDASTVVGDRYREAD